jgi:hypothetical protein
MLPQDEVALSPTSIREASDPPNEESPVSALNDEAFDEEDEDLENLEAYEEYR